MNYGLPYKGSKNKLAEKINELFPRKKHFYDLFCGGCAITHRALIENKFETYTINDINPMCAELFNDAINGKFKNEKRWISREDFEKSNESYVKFCWSFGNNLKNYLYSKEIEDKKKAWHYALYFNDFEPMKKYGVDLSVLDNEKDLQKKYWNSKKIIWETAQGFLNVKRSHLELERLESLERLERLQSLESLERLERLQSLERLERLQSLNKSYDNIEIQSDSVIYCDIPYKNTDSYLTSFNHDKFYDWCRNQKELVLISEYQMPDDFICVAQFKHNCSLGANSNNKVIERLFIPAHQKELFYSTKHLDLYDLMTL